MAEQVVPYEGTDNLEVMAEAVNYNRFLVRLVTRHLRRDGTVLDFGAGIGTFAAWVREEGFSVEALDIEPEHQAAIRAAGIPAIGSLSDVADARFAGIYSLNVLEHIEDDMGVLRELFRVLEPGGSMVIYVPAFRFLFTSMDHKVGHVRRYTRKELTSKIAAAGFVVNRLRYADSAGVAATLVFKWFGNDSGDLNPAAVKAYDRIAFPISRLLDSVFGLVVGKNVYAVASKPAVSHP